MIPTVRIDLPLVSYIGFKLEELIEAYITVDLANNNLMFVEKYWSFEWDEDDQVEADGKQYYRDRTYAVSLHCIGGVSLCWRELSEAWVINIENTLNNDLKFVIELETVARDLYSQLLNAIKPNLKLR